METIKKRDKDLKKLGIWITALEKKEVLKLKEK